MLFRFCLYGFLKNQQYYDPFLILAFREKGLSFAMIGLLIGFREICIAVLEVPTGAVADVAGRRRSMIFSHLAYIAAFATFAFAENLGLLFAAMFCFSLGEAFRTGTHKAIIFDWLTHVGAEDKKVHTYGLTRSWSKMGSAVSVVIAAGLVFTMGRYSTIFLFSIVPYLANVVNFLTYPSYLDGPRSGGSLREVLATVGRSVVDAVRSRPLRRLFIESMGFEGAFKVCKDYLQPVLRSAALAAPVLLALGGRQRTALLVGGVYFVLHLLSSAASRRSHAVVRWAGSEDRGAHRLWAMYAAAFAAMACGFGAAWTWLAVAAFVALSVIQNFWRPILVGRFVAHADPARTATLLSIESQAKALFAAAIAPLLGLAVDLMGHLDLAPDRKFLPVAAVGVVIGVVLWLTGRKK